MRALEKNLGSRARFNRPLGPHTTWGVGGPAWCLCGVRTAQEAAWVLKATREADMPWMILGKGSNLLVADTGYPGVALRLTGELAGITPTAGGLMAGGGASLARCLRLSARLGLSGLEWAAGIPGTVGGAIATNAGAFGQDMAGVAERLTLLLPNGKVVEAPGADFPATYRRRQLPLGSIVLEARLTLKPASAEEVTSRVGRFRQKRAQAQPQGVRSAGSVFKNPPGDFAGRLIEAAGCKGMQVGGAMVSPKHANFIVSQNRTSAADILALMDQVRARVKEHSGVELIPEVETVGHV